MEVQPDEGKGKITIPWKWRDEEGELDLSDPNDLDKAKRLINQGHGYEKGQQELKTVKGDYEKAREQIEYWNNLIEDAKDTKDTTRVLAALEMSGIKMDGDDSEPVLDVEDKRFKELETKYSKLEAALYTKYTTDAHSQLEAKYKDGNYPEYKRKEVEDFANEKGIREFEDAYFIMNKEDILKAQAKDDIDKSKKHSDKIKKVASIEPGSGNLPAQPVEKHTNYGKATEAWTSDPAITESLFDDE